MATGGSSRSGSRSYTKRWKLIVDDENAIHVIKGGLTVKDKNGKPVGPLVSLTQPTSSKACAQARNYLAHAIEVYTLTHLLYKQYKQNHRLKL